VLARSVVSKAGVRRERGREECAALRALSIDLSLEKRELELSGELTEDRMLATKVSAKLAQMRLGQRLSSNNSIIVACGSLVMVTYVVRASLSVMSVSMAAELGWTKEAEGSVLSAFFYGYICTNLTGSLACRRFGAKPVVALSVAAFCTLTFLLPAAAAVSIDRLWWARVATGVAQGPIFASIFHIYGATIPQEQRARAVAAVNACAPLGIAACYLLGPLIESHLGWRATLRAAGLSGVPWLVVWLCKMDVDPPPAMAVLGPGTGVAVGVPVSGHGKGAAAAASAARGVDAGAGAGAGAAIPWKQIATEPAFLVVAFAHFAFAWGQYVMLAWLPTYFVEALGLPESQLGVAAVPYVLMMCSALSAGILADALLKRRVKLLAVRRGMTLLGL
jgi:ACS family sodium-dependent inorganic phosphate cotransporter